MALESATHLNQLVSTNPTGSDQKAQGDDHIRMLKAVLQTDFPAITGPVTATQAELNILDGATVTTAELNHSVGVTSPIQTQIDAKAPAASPTLTGTVTVSGGQIAFPATQNASANANTLDDYEEGTWTPSLGGNTTYTSQVGSYTKIGRLVYLQFYLHINVHGTGSPNTISGMPFASSGTGYFTGAIIFSNLAVAATSLFCYNLAGQSVIQITGLTAAATSMTNGFIGSGTIVGGAFVYHV